MFECCFADFYITVEKLNAFNLFKPSFENVLSPLVSIGLLILTVTFCLTRELTGWGSGWTTWFTWKRTTWVE